MIQRSDVEHIAKLARLELTPQEIEQYQNGLSFVLEYFEILGELDVSKVQPMTHSVAHQNVKRKDEAGTKIRARAAQLLEMAPETKDGFVKVKSIL